MPADAPNADSDWAHREGRHLWMPYSQMKTATPPLDVAGTDRDQIILQDGRTLVDGIASWWTACHGYNHPHIVNALVTQAQELPHVMFAGLVHAPAKQLADRLAQLLPADLNRVFFCDSGSVAVEVAMKIAVQYWLNHGEPGRQKFVCFQHSYHGDTTGAMSVCDPEDSMHAHFKGFLLEQFPAPVPETADALAQLDRFLTVHQDHVAAVIIEPLAQMAAGMRFHTPATLRNIHDVCRRHGQLLIADEIATGFGRTGTMFAVEQAEVCPDIMCLGKALTGGCLTLAATAVRDPIYQAFHTDRAIDALMHGPTYMANPLACAAAIASMDLFQQEPRRTEIAKIAGAFTESATALNKLPAVRTAESLGAILAVRFEEDLPRDETTKWFIKQGIWLRPIRNVLYACPPFTIAPSNLDRLIDAIHRFSAR